MKKVSLPKPHKLFSDSETETTAAEYVRNNVLILGFWKLDGLSRTEAALEIDEALDKDPENPIVSDDTANLWGESMKLMGPNGPVGEIRNPRANIFFLKIQRAVLRAEKVEVKKPDDS